jgi:hypothetical protein
MPTSRKQFCMAQLPSNYVVSFLCCAGDPITRSRDKDASSKDRELGAARAE